MDRGNERDDSVGGIGLGGPQSGDIGGDDEHQRKDGSGTDAGAGGEGAQRHPGGSSRDSENLA
jgi:hypothetical protein